MEECDPGRYLFHSEDECDRLELQASIAGIEGHLRHLRIPERAQVLDAGCGSGSMSRLLARHHPDSTVIGFDLNPDYVAYARALATKENLANLSFREGNVQALPFAVATFDLVWSKHVLFFVPSPEEAIAEFRRVTKPGGTVVIVLEDWYGLVLDPKDDELRRSLLAIFGEMAKVDVTSRLPSMMMRAGFVEVSVQIEASPVYTIIGAVDLQRRRNHEIEMQAARPQIARILGSETACDDFYAAWFGYLDRPDTCTILPMWFVQGTVPF